MAGIANTWMDQYTDVATPCITGAGAANTNSSVSNTTTTNTTTTASNCLLWLIGGLLIGSLLKGKKK